MPTLLQAFYNHTRGAQRLAQAINLHKPPEQGEMEAAVWNASRILGMHLPVISLVPPSAS